MRYSKVPTLSPIDVEISRTTIAHCFRSKAETVRNGRFALNEPALLASVDALASRTSMV